ncbi:MAG: hypothetical protein IK990_04755 [Ruminiclostridium sp.]|nr:hypothetical protein [Ruminiclostridium sp.]
MKDDNPRDSFPARLEDMCALAIKRGQPVYSAFLNDREQYEAEKLLGKRSGIDILFWGGNEVCMRRILRVSSPDMYAGSDFDDFPVYPVTLTFRKADRPGHRDFLGSFMALGIKRETVGDIFIGEGTAAVFCTGTARDMITGSITTVGRIGVSVSDGLTAQAKECIAPPKISEMTITVSSQRADCIVAGITGMSRERSAEFIRSGGFMQNYTECENVSRNVSEGDTLTLRGYGKFIVGGEPGLTHKGRLRITIKKYI